MLDSGRLSYNRWLPPWWIVVILVTVATIVRMADSQCPWPRTPLHVSLHSDCVCGYSNVRRLSVQCSPMANFSQLLEVLNSPSVQRLPIDMLYINNATGLSSLPRNAFRKLDIQQIHLTNTYLERIDKDAFAGLEDKLNSLTLQNAGLKDVPAPIKSLKALKTLDLSNNRIRRIRSGTFEEMHLTTLRLSFNPELQLERESFRGLSRTLKNLNLKGLALKQIPESIVNLTELAFLDLAQNKIEEIKPRMFRNHHLLTALSLERNLIRSMHPDTFVGLNDSLSSLSLLNNMLVEFPLLALSKLIGLRVLDLGFNAIRQLPDQAFRSNELLTLLALDGNPLRTLSFTTFRHLNHTLRGLSVGGKYFECDCKVRWLAEWAREYNLQITSRERNPQFCAKPPHLRNKPFTHIDFDDFVCPPLADSGISSSSVVPFPSPVFTSSSTTTTTTTTAKTTTTTAGSTTTSSLTSGSTSLATTTTTPSTTTSTTSTTTPSPVIQSATSYVVQVAPENDNHDIITTTIGATSKTTNFPVASVRITDATYRNGSGVQVRWEALSRKSTGGYQVWYRYHGSKKFQRTETLASRFNSYTIKIDSPPNVVCVVNLDDLDTNGDNGENQIPSGQCREVTMVREPLPPPSIIKKPTIVSTRSSTTSPPTSTISLSSLYPSLKRLNDIDKIVIGISASVCLFIIVAVLIFSCCFYRSSSSKNSLRTLTTNPACLSTKSLSPLAKSSFEHEWETVSVYSTRSIPRARINQANGNHATLYGGTDTLRSHLSHHQPGYIHPVSRYIGATLPPRSATGYRNPWLEAAVPSGPYLHHYPSVNHLPSMGYNGPSYYPATSLQDVIGSTELRSGPLPPQRSAVERSKSHRHAARARSKPSSRTRRQQIMPAGPAGPPQIHSKSHIDLRSAAGSNGSSSNRLLLSSSTSNSYQSTQNDYDSDQWNGHGNGPAGSSNHTAGTSPTTTTGTTGTYLYNGQSHHHHSSSSNHLSVPGTAASRSTPTTTSRTMNNDNEVDIYIDQHYAKRFNFS